MKKLYIFVFLVFVCVLLLALYLFGNFSLTGGSVKDLNRKSDIVIINFFWGDGCPYCAAQKPFLKELESKYSEKIKINYYEVWYNESNSELFNQISMAYGVKPRGVPYTFVCDKYWIGFSESIARDIERYVLQSIDKGCRIPY